jgi:hypothetical protein
MGIRARHMMGNPNPGEKGVEFLILSTPIRL